MCLGAGITYLTPFNLAYEMFAYAVEEKIKFPKAGLNVSLSNSSCGPIDFYVLRYDYAQ